ncbi:2049_t:CDS:2, partial [Dentiscutata heterogama]
MRKSAQKNSCEPSTSHQFLQGFASARNGRNRKSLHNNVHIFDTQNYKWITILSQEISQNNSNTNSLAIGLGVGIGGLVLVNIYSVIVTFENMSNLSQLLIKFYQDIRTYSHLSLNVLSTKCAFME